MINEAVLFSFRAVAMMALCTVCFGMIQRSITTELVRNMLFGLVTGVGAATLMLQPIVIAEGYQVNGGTVFIGIAAIFGGPIATAVAAAITVTTRLAINDAGSFLGCSIILATAMLANLWVAFGGTSHRRTFLEWCTLSAVLMLPVSALMLAPVPNRAEWILFVFALTVTDVLIFGRLLEAEQRRGNRERELNAAANTDTLTQLPNRRSFMEGAAAAEHCKQTGKGLLLVDIDHFKLVNDTFGHKAGDEVLRHVGQRLADLTRKSDIVARFGGEEFALLVDAIDETDLGNIADRVRQALNVKVDYNASAIPLSVSIGGTYCGKHPFHFNKAYLDADKSLYRAKEGGRARSVITLLGA